MAHTVLGYFQTLVWPVVVLALVLFFLIRFRDNVANFLDRVTEARGPAGIGVSAAAPLPSSQDELVDDLTGDFISLENLRGVVDDYEEQLQQAHVEHEQNVERMVQDVVTARLELDFERTYRVILGSQVQALKALRDANPASVPRSLIEPIFNAVKVHYAAALSAWTFEQWIRFLLQPGYAGQGLVEQLGDGTYRLRPRGWAFLLYLDNQRLPEKLF